MTFGTPYREWLCRYAARLFVGLAYLAWGQFLWGNVFGLCITFIRGPYEHRYPRFVFHDE